MELGMIGLGRMGTNMVQRLMRAGPQCVVYDLQPEAVLLSSLRYQFGGPQEKPAAAKAQA